VDRTTGEGWFLSFSGKIYPAKLGPTPKIEKPWSINAAAGLPVAGTGVQELAWRPGGGQLMALHRATRKLYVVMHTGNYWTQKMAGTEVWILDASTKSLIRRVPMPKPIKNIAVTQDDKPILFAFGGEGGPGGGDFTAFDANTGKKLRGRSLGSAIALVPGW
jgi:methylamine dehydrogenase heavy chain